MSSKFSVSIFIEWSMVWCEDFPWSSAPWKLLRSPRLLQSGLPSDL